LTPDGAGGGNEGLFVVVSRAAHQPRETEQAGQPEGPFIQTPANGWKATETGASISLFAGKAIPGRSVRKCIFLFISLPQIGAANANRKDNRDRRDL